MGFKINSNHFIISEICQIRLDFSKVILDQPSTTTIGDCTTTDSDQLTAKSPSSSKQGNIPILCGTLTGSHSKCYIRPIS